MGKYSYLFAAVIIAVSSLFISSCKKQSYIKLAFEEKMVQSKGETFTVSVESSSNWIVKEDEEITWCSISKVNNSEAKIVVLPNNTYDIRSAIFRFQCEDVQASLVITQSLPANILSYTSSDENVINPRISAFSSDIKSNEYKDGYGVITFSSDINGIGYDAFFNCTSLTSIIIPEGVTSIGGCAFEGCTSLTSITIPEGVISIGSGAFEGCTSLTSITLPETLTFIGDDTFKGCTSLASVYCKPRLPPSINKRGCMFDNNAPERKIYVPVHLVALYKIYTGWSDYSSSIVGYNF